MQKTCIAAGIPQREDSITPTACDLQ